MWDIGHLDDVRYGMKDWFLIINFIWSVFLRII